MEAGRQQGSVNARKYTDCGITPRIITPSVGCLCNFLFLHHEFIHALGFREHNTLFRSLEHSWPGIDAGDLGPKFTEYLRRKSAKWLWVCEGCKIEFPRKKSINGGYKCRKCGTVLTDKKL